MSEENVELVRQHIGAFLHDTATSLSFLDPSVVFDRRRVGTPDSELVYGHDAGVQAKRFWRPSPAPELRLSRGLSPRTQRRHAYLCLRRHRFTGAGAGGVRPITQPSVELGAYE